MTMRNIAPAMMMAALFAAAPGHAFDASGADVLGLRLGMAETEIVDRLARQGVPVTRLIDPCEDHDTCVSTLKASTRDGQLTISVSAGTGMKQVQYMFRGRAMDEPATIKAAMSERFGRPDQQTPMRWCRTVAADGACLRQQATLTFLPETLTMILKAGEAGPR
jgi:hypothetical protein